MKQADEIKALRAEVAELRDRLSAVLQVTADLAALAARLTARESAPASSETHVGTIDETVG